MRFPHCRGPVCRNARSMQRITVYRQFSPRGAGFSGWGKNTRDTVAWKLPAYFTEGRVYPLAKREKQMKTLDPRVRRIYNRTLAR